MKDPSITAAEAARAVQTLSDRYTFMKSEEKIKVVLNNILSVWTSHSVQKEERELLSWVTKEPTYYFMRHSPLNSLSYELTFDLSILDKLI